VLLFAILAGFVAYGLWRLADALLDSEGHGDDGKAKVKRAVLLQAASSIFSSRSRPTG
jgi:hypothetical protein